jgi:transcriptional regulator of nitric oxide reductase
MIITPWDLQLFLQRNFLMRAVTLWSFCFCLWFPSLFSLENQQTDPQSNNNKRKRKALPSTKSFWKRVRSNKSVLFLGAGLSATVSLCGCILLWKKHCHLSGELKKERAQSRLLSDQGVELKQ